VVEIRDAYEVLWRECLVAGATAGVFTAVDLRTARLALLELCTGAAHWFDPPGGLTPIGPAGRSAEPALGRPPARRARRWLNRLNVGGPNDEEVYEIVVNGSPGIQAEVEGSVVAP